MISVGDTWSGTQEALATFSASISSGAVVIASSAGNHINVRSILVASDTAGVVVFTNTNGGQTLAKIYLAANTNLLITEDLLGKGIRSAKGDSITATLSSATLTLLARYRYDPN